MDMSWQLVLEGFQPLIQGSQCCHLVLEQSLVQRSQSFQSPVQGSQSWQLAQEIFQPLLQGSQLIQPY
jgi:hypothetical protein